MVACVSDRVINVKLPAIITLPAIGTLMCRQNVDRQNADGHNVDRQNVEQTKCRQTKCRTDKMSNRQNVERTKCRTDKMSNQSNFREIVKKILILIIALKNFNMYVVDIDDYFIKC